ncbi:MAG: DUF1326 domain-containing protein [Bryobacteraceae bacterium]
MYGYPLDANGASVGHACATKSEVARYDGKSWSLDGAGVVCCPCRVPCPCRRNGPPSFGHCEATLYLHIKQGRYGTTDLAGLRMIDSGGACSMTYHTLSALYFDERSSPDERAAMLKLIASMFTGGAAEFSRVRAVPLDTDESSDRFFRISIPGTLRMEVDRNWGQQTAPFPWVAAVDHFSNALQYVQNVRYEIHDPEAHIDFDYSHRQANYRLIHLSHEDYANKRMLIQYMDATGNFNEDQLRLIRALRLEPPDDLKFAQLARSLRVK